MIKPIVALAAVLVLICCLASPLEAKLLRRQRIYDDSFGGSPYGGYDGPQSGVATGERAIMTIRGARGPYGMAPSRIQIEDNPYRGPYPRGVYDRLESSYSGGRSRMPYYPQSDYGYSNYEG